MSRSVRRFEVLLPLRFNDGANVPDEFISSTMAELEACFGAVSCETQTIRGYWTSEGEPFRDELFRVFLDVEDSPDAWAFFVDYKERLKARFEQIDIWMTTYLIEVI